MKTKIIFGYSVLSLILGTTLVARPAHANEVCDTVDSCRELQAKVEAKLEELLSNITPALDDIVKNNDKEGSVRNMNQYDADKYCKEHHTRLPKPRELALLSMSLGAAGIRETTHPRVSAASSVVQSEISKMNKDGYYPIYALNSAKRRVVDFYFNHVGYKHPSGDLGIYFFWTELVLPINSSKAYILDSTDGSIGEYPHRDNISGYSAVRCVTRHLDATN